jgi:FHS family glucose/mannose:H+ symporter-like MFS transporter
MNSSVWAGASGLPRLRFSAWAGIFVFGIVMAMLGAILPSLFERIGFGAAAAGNLFLTMNFAMLVTTLFFGPLVDRFGFKALLAVSAFLVAVAFLLLSRASTYGLVLVAAVVLGLGGGGLNGGTNALTSDIHEGDKRGAALNVLGIFFGFGALSIPFLIGTLRELLGLRVILQLAAFLSLVPFVIYVALPFPKAKQARGFPIKAAAGIVRSPLLWLCAFILFFQSANEFTVGGWISTYLQKTFGLGGGAAALVLAGYWAAMMSGRLLSSRLLRAVRGVTLVFASASLALLAAVLMAVAPAGAAAAAGAVAIGFGFAAIYPTTLAIVGERFASFTGTAFSLVIAVGLVGGMLAPWLAGKIAQSSSLRQGLLIPVFDCAMIVVLSGFVGRALKKEKKERNPA